MCKQHSWGSFAMFLLDHMPRLEMEARFLNGESAGNGTGRVGIPDTLRPFPWLPNIT